MGPALKAWTEGGLVLAVPSASGTEEHHRAVLSRVTGPRSPFASVTLRTVSSPLCPASRFVKTKTQLLWIP